MEQTSVPEAKSIDPGAIPHHYGAIRGGLSWPTEEANGYFIILGEKYAGGGTQFEGHKPKRGEIVLLAEREIQSPFLNDTLKALTDECSLVGCHDVYAEFEEKPELNMEDVLLARELLNKEAISISLNPAPFHREFKTGMDIIRLYLNDALLVLPESSLVSQQLGVLSQVDLMERPEVKFVAINGLRFAMGAFHKYGPPGPVFKPKRRHEGPHYSVRRPR